jgi:hypothetical protein
MGSAAGDFEAMLREDVEPALRSEGLERQQEEFSLPGSNHVGKVRFRSLGGPEDMVLFWVALTVESLDPPSAGTRPRSRSLPMWFEQLGSLMGRGRGGEVWLLAPTDAAAAEGDAGGPTPQRPAPPAGVVPQDRASVAAELIGALREIGVPRLREQLARADAGELAPVAQGRGGFRGADREQYLRRLAQWSRYDIPANYQLPRLGGGPAMPYQLVRFPVAPWNLTHARSEPDPKTDPRWAEIAGRWMNGVVQERLPVIEAALAALGAPRPDGDRPDHALLQLGEWLQKWFPVVAEPYHATTTQPRPSSGSSFFLEWHGDVGVEWGPWTEPSSYSPVADALLHSLCVDIAALLTAAARTRLPDLTWSLRPGGETDGTGPRRLHLVLDPGQHDPEPQTGRESIVVRPPPAFALVELVRYLLVQSLRPAPGTRGRELRRRQARLLLDGLVQATTGVGGTSIAREFPGGTRVAALRLETRSKGTLPPRADLLEAVGALRPIGWFADWRGSTEDLATAVQRQWQLTTGRELPLDPHERWWSLVIADGGRAWVQDVDAGIASASTQTYMSVLAAIGQIGGRAFGSIGDPGDVLFEQWRPETDEVVIAFRWRRKRREMVFPRPMDGLLSPQLFVAFNSLLAPDEPRLFFADHGPTIGIVVRATEQERSAFHELSAIELRESPPAWWVTACAEGLAALGDYDGFDPFALGEPAGAPRRVRDDGAFDYFGELLSSPVGISDVTAEGEEIIFSVAPSVEMYVRSDPLAETLDRTMRDALRAVPDVTDVEHANNEEWLVHGGPQEAAIEQAAADAVTQFMRTHEDRLRELLGDGER